LWEVCRFLLIHADHIPSVAVLKGGGYEPVDSMIYYGQPGPFTEDVEDRIVSAVHGVAKRVGR
jgi:neutral ceramidase